MPTKNDNPVFTVTFKKGQAEEGRLPLTHVIDTLRELDAMIREVGIRIQRERGIEQPDGDFGIELLAGRSGLAFLKGSIRSNAAITRDVDNGIEAITRVMETTDAIEKKHVVSIDEYRAPVLRRYVKISAIQEKDKTELRLRLSQPGREPRLTKFSRNGIEAIQAMEREPAELSVESLTVYGKLRELKDKSRQDDIGDHFWGELLEDNGHTWRVRFRRSEMGDVLKYFTKQVAVFGDASYFKTRSPRLEAKTIHEDSERDYVAGFDAFEEMFSDVFGEDDPRDILDDIRG